MRKLLLRLGYEDNEPINGEMCNLHVHRGIGGAGELTPTSPVIAQSSRGASVIITGNKL